MANNPIGISFMPSAENSELGPQQGAAENPSSDLAQAFKILSLHLPRNLSPHAIASQGLLNGAGSAGVGAPGANPFAAAFEAMIRAMLGSQGAGYLPPTSAAPSYTLPGAPVVGPGTSRPPTRVTPGDSVPAPTATPIPGGEPGGKNFDAPVPTAPTASSIPERPLSGDRSGMGRGPRDKGGFFY